MPSIPAVPLEFLHFQHGLKAVPFKPFITLGGPQGHDSSVEEHSHEWFAELQIPRLPRISCHAALERTAA
jgi:hypothetical protein